MQQLCSAFFFNGSIKPGADYRQGGGGMASRSSPRGGSMTETAPPVLRAARKLAAIRTA